MFLDGYRVRELKNRLRGRGLKSRGEKVVFFSTWQVHARKLYFYIEVDENISSRFHFEKLFPFSFFTNHRNIFIPDHRNRFSMSQY